MILRIFFLALIGVTMASVANAQPPPLILELRSGYGSYSMKQFSQELHYYQEQNEGILPLKVVADFPGYYNFGMNALAKLDGYDIGLSYGLYSTGGRLHYEDYSGEAGLEHLMKMNSIAFTGRYYFVNKPRFNVSLTVQIPINFTSMTSRTWTRDTGHPLVQEKDDYVSRSVGLTLMPGIQYYITPHLYVGGRAGAFVDNKGRPHEPGNRKNKLVGYDNKPIYTDWTGWRAEIFIAYVWDMAEKE